MSGREGLVERCAGCGLAIDGGTTGCQAIMDELLARDFSDVGYFRVHRNAGRPEAPEELD